MSKKSLSADRPFPPHFTPDFLVGVECDAKKVELLQYLQ